MNILYLLNVVLIVVVNETEGSKENGSSLSFVEQKIKINNDKLGESDKKSEHEDLENESIRFNTTKIVVGLEYLGSGYDIVKANTVGDSDQGEDLGYRAPVIDFTWAQTDVGVTNSLDSLQPVGGWVRPKVSCGESENVTEIESISKLKELAEADVGVDVNVTNVGSGSLNTQYQNLKDNDENRSNKLYTNTYYCFTYAAGIPPTLDWTTSEEFRISVSELPKNISDYEDCSLLSYKERKKACKDILRWMEFFNEFGTHVVTQIHLGGKLTRYLSVPSSMIESLSKKGYDINIVVGAVISGVSGNLSLGVSENDEKELENLKKSSKLKFSVLGGIHPNKDISEASIRKWKSTVPKYPMPIKIDLSSISTFLPKGYYNSFKEALSFYISLNKALPWDIEQKEGRIMTLKSMLVNSKQVLFSGSGEDISVAKCPNGKRVLFGFILTIDNDFNTTINPCTQNKKSCSFEKINDKTNIIIYIVCGNSLGLEFDVKYENNQNFLECDDGDEIVTGFNINIKEAKFTACKTGERFCKSDNKGSMIIVCTDKRLPELNILETKGSISKDNKVNIGGDKFTLIGFVGCVGENSYMILCETFANGCKLLTKESCKVSFGWGMFMS